MARLKPAKTTKISQSDALAILEWIHGKSGLKAKDMTKEDMGYAQSMMVELLNASFAMGFVEALFRSAAKLPKGPQKVIKSFLKGAGKNLVKYQDKDDLKEMMKKPVIYKAAVSTLARNTKSIWKIRLETGEW